MADLRAQRASAFAPFIRAAEAATLSPLPPVARFSFRGRPAAIEVAAGAFGVALPQQACRAATAGERAALWLGPDEWLLLAPEAEGPAIAAAFAEKLAGLPHALVDIGHRNVALEIAGDAAATVLNIGCPLDLDPAAFPVGMCTRTVFGKAEIVLWRTGETRFRLECWRSFAGYVWGLIEEARRELGAHQSHDGPS